MSEPVFDRSALERSAAGDEALACELTSLFLTEAEESAARLGAALEPIDRGELRATAHRLRGSAGIVGAKRLRAACAELETHIDDSSEEIGRLVASLLAASDDACRAMAPEGS